MPVAQLMGRMEPLLSGLDTYVRLMDNGMINMHLHHLVIPSTGVSPWDYAVPVSDQNSILSVTDRKRMVVTKYQFGIYATSDGSSFRYICTTSIYIKEQECGSFGEYVNYQGGDGETERMLDEIVQRTVDSIVDRCGNSESFIYNLPVEKYNSSDSYTPDFEFQPNGHQ